ncbi:MAG: hypothetical protein ACXVCV_16140, partial [Polyangia bacterium]
HVRWSVLAACLLCLGLVSGCYSPQVKNGGFACSMTDDPPCPNGFFCVNGLCQDHPGMSSGDVDLSTGTGGNGGGGGGGGGGSTMADMAHAAADLASTDMAQAPMCGAQLDPCTNNSDCCNMVCVSIGAGSVCLI